MTTPPGRGDTAPAHPNWRDNPDQLDALCQYGAELLHGPTPVARDVETINPSEDYL